MDSLKISAKDCFRNSQQNSCMNFSRDVFRYSLRAPKFVPAILLEITQINLGIIVEPLKKFPMESLKEILLKNF